MSGSYFVISTFNEAMQQNFALCLFLSFSGLMCKFPKKHALFSCADGTSPTAPGVQWRRHGMDGWLGDKGRVKLIGQGTMNLTELQTSDSGIYEGWLRSDPSKLACKKYLWVSPSEFFLS